MSPAMELRMREVFEVVARGGRWSISEVAAAVGLKRTPYLGSLLVELVEGGHLSREYGMMQTPRGIRYGWLYFLPEAE